MLGFVEYAAPENNDPIADLFQAVYKSPLQQNRKFVDNTEYYLVPTAVIDALLAPQFKTVEPEDAPVEVSRVPAEVEAALARADIESLDDFSLDMEVTKEVPGTYEEDHGPDDEVDHEFEDEIKDDSDLVDLPDEPQHPGYGEDLSDERSK